MGGNAKQCPELRPAGAELRRAAFISTAREAFLTDGYGGTTMSAIAGRVGGSKTTLWSYFPSKEALFGAVVDDIVEAFGCELSDDLPVEQDTRVVLTLFANRLLNLLMSPPVVALHRLVAGEAQRFPHLAESFYSRGPEKGKARLVAFIRAKMDHGDLRSGDPYLAGRQFQSLCQWGLYPPVLFGGRAAPTKNVIETEADWAADSFLRAWGRAHTVDQA